MFYNQPKLEAMTVPSPSAQATLREELRQRLRLLAEFATLGAYELTDAASPDVHQDAPHAREREATRRVFLFSRATVSTCAHSPEASRSCPATGAAQIARHARPSARRRVARRRGGVAAAQQPCTVTAIETTAGRPAR
jgi:hypothetical protein